MTQEAIKETLSSIFGENGYEITFLERERFSLILHYPYITIKNDFAEKHLIKDLYIQISGERKTRKAIRGLRGSLSYGEFSSGYNHSHIMTGVHTNFSDFCLGTSELTMLLYEDIFESDSFLRYFCIVLENYLSWESIEGVPYIRMNSVSPFGRLSSPNYDAYWLKNLKLGLKLEVNINFTIKNVLEVEDAIYKEVCKLDDYYRNYATVNKIGNVYYNTNQARNSNSYNGVNLFKFNGKDIKLQIEEFKQEENEKIKKTVHPDITQIWCSRASRAIKNYYISSNRIKSSQTA